jgi:V-type H+-transporting ATPase subunit H
VVQELGAKQRIMELMSHDNAEVRYNALLAVQQYMSSSWEL